MFQPTHKNLDTTNILQTDFLGLGVQWDIPDHNSYTPEQWEKIFARMEAMQFRFVRCMLSPFYFAKQMADGHIAENFENARMQSLYKILDYCQAKNMTVIVGIWNGAICKYVRRHPLGREITISDSADPRLAEVEADLIEQIVCHRGYSCVRFYNHFNEPNGNWTINERGGNYNIWKKGMLNLDAALKKRGIRNRIMLMGPDSLEEDNWVDLCAEELHNVLDIYDLHRYAYDGELDAGFEYNMLREKREVISSLDPNGKQKQFFVGEAGIFQGRNDNDQQYRVKLWEYGVLMSDYICQILNAGCSGAILWMLEDSMHYAAPYSYEDDPQLKIWGFWNAIGDEEDQKLRPWAYPMAAIAKVIPPHSSIINMGFPAHSGLRFAAALAPDGSLNIIAVNKELRNNTVSLQIPGWDKVTVDRYHFDPDSYPMEDDGTPIPQVKDLPLDISGGLEVAFQTQGVQILHVCKA